MMRRLLLSSAKPNQPYHNQHNRHNGGEDTVENLRLHRDETASCNTPGECLGQTEAPRKVSFPVVKKGIRFSRSLTRTRSETDLIRAMAKKNAKKKKKKRLPWAESDYESDEDSLFSEDGSRHATSLRSFTREDEERYAQASWKNTCAGGICSKIGEEDEQSSTAAKCSMHHDRDPHKVPASENDPAPTILANMESKPSTVSPLSDFGPCVQQVELQSTVLPRFELPSHEEDSKTHLTSESGNESTSVTTGLDGSEVDLEYLLHENDLLKDSLEHVTQERDYLAQDNWNLRVELENLRNQMRFLTTASGDSSPTMYTMPAICLMMDPSGSPYLDPRSLNHPHHQGYVSFAQPCTQTFEELLHESSGLRPSKRST